MSKSSDKLQRRGPESEDVFIAIARAKKHASSPRGRWTLNCEKKEGQP